MSKQSEFSSMKYRLFTSLWLILFTLMLLLGGCAQEANDAGSGSEEKDTTIATIKITPGGLMFTNMNESQNLTATAYNAAGEALDVTDFTWETSKPDSVSVDASGTATAQTSLGSATITAHAAGVTSTPLLISIAQPVPGAALINDSQVVGDIRPHDTSEPLSLGSLYDVTLTGITPPGTGDILISTGEAPVAGRVVEVREENGQTIVTLEFVGLDELFTAFTINETLPMPAGDIEINPELEATYDITRNPDGSLTFTPRQELSVIGAVTGTSVRSMGPFECGTDLSIFPLGLSAAPTFTLTRVFDYQIVWEDSYKKLAVTGTLTVERTDSWALTSSLTGKVTCEIEIASIPLPIPGGVATLFFSGRVPVGLGIEASGQISLTGLGFEMKAKTGGEVEAGLEAPNGDDWQILSDYTQTDNSFETKWTPLPDSIADTLRLTPALSGYAFANLNFGLRLPRSPRWQVVASKLGLNMTGNLALVDGQIEDLTYASDYKLSLDASIGPGSGITNFLNRLRMNLSGAGITLTVPLSTSPKATEITADVDQFSYNDPINFTVKLDPAFVDFLGIYNITRVKIYRRTTDLFGDIVADYIASITPTAPGQTEFNRLWFADEEGWISDGNYYVFIETKFLPFPYFETLELGQVKAPSNKIVFLRAQDIYVMNADGTGQTRLSNHTTGWDNNFALSPDGTKIAFRGTRLNAGGVVYVTDLYVMNVDGTGQTNLTNSATSQETHPAWSPDSTKIAFGCQIDGIYWEICVINADGTGLTRFTNNTSGDSAPVWSPDDTKIAFECWRDDSWEICVMNTDGSGQTNLTNSPHNGNGSLSGEDLQPTWSPDSAKIAFMSRRDGNPEIYMMNADGSGLTNLTNNAAGDEHPVWSPDGTKIAFVSRRDGNQEIYVMNADGTGQTRLTNNAVRDDYPAWSPDSEKIAFDSNAEIYVMNADGTGLTNLTNNAADSYPAWLP